MAQNGETRNSDPSGTELIFVLELLAHENMNGGAIVSKRSAIDQAIIYIKSNWRDGKTVKEVANFHEVDAGNLERAFRNRAGVTIKRYVDEQRKKYVLSQLNGKMKLGYEIGAAIGFSEDLSFYRWVKRAFGISFKALRLRIRQNSATRKRNKE